MNVQVLFDLEDNVTQEEFTQEIDKYENGHDIYWEDAKKGVITFMRFLDDGDDDVVDEEYISGFQIIVEDAGGHVTEMYIL